jgi:hypothetical protein
MMEMLEKAKSALSPFVVPRAIGVVKPELDGETRDEYLRVAAAIGLTESPAVQAERMRVVLQSENIRCYDDAQVHRFLDHKLGKGKWVWSPLRASDLEHRRGWQDGAGVRFGSSIYSDKVPLPVLLTIEKIHASCPDAHFYVSSNQTDEDPFLYVTAGVRGYIVERWDEPNFRER